MVYPARSPEALPVPMPSCWFIFAGMWLFVYNYVLAESLDCFAEKINKKDYFLMRRWSIEIVPEISLPPCIGTIFSLGIDNKLNIYFLSFTDFYFHPRIASSYCCPSHSYSGGKQGWFYSLLNKLTRIWSLIVSVLDDDWTCIPCLGGLIFFQSSGTQKFDKATK